MCYHMLQRERTEGKSSQARIVRYVNRKRTSVPTFCHSEVTIDDSTVISEVLVEKIGGITGVGKAYALQMQFLHVQDILR